jgi:hypothetical protein
VRFEIRDDGFTRYHSLPFGDEYGRRSREIDIHPAAKPYDAYTLARRDTIALPNVGHDTPRCGTGDENHPDTQRVFRLNREAMALVFAGRFGRRGIVVDSGVIDRSLNASRDRRSGYVHVEQRKKDRNAR